MSGTQRIIRSALRAPSELLRWYITPAGVVAGALLAAAVGFLAAGSSVGAIAMLAVFSAAVLPFKLIRERHLADSRRSAVAKQVENKVRKTEDRLVNANGELVVEVAELRKFTEISIGGVRSTALSSISTLRSHLAALRQDQSAAVALSDHWSAALTARADEISARLESAIDRIAQVEGRSPEPLQDSRFGEFLTGIERLEERIAEHERRVEQRLRDQEGLVHSDGSGAHYHLAPGYRRRAVAAEWFDDTENEDNWQREVYDYALGVAIQSGAKSICDFGCGSGFKLMQRFSDFETLGIDTETTVEFLQEKYPDKHWAVSELPGPELFDDFDIVIAADVIEHLEDPALLLDALARSRARTVILSTPARELLIERGGRPFGPPLNPSHYCEWTSDEFRQFVDPYLEIVVQRISNQEQSTQLVHGRVRTGS